MAPNAQETRRQSTNDPSLDTARPQHETFAESAGGGLILRTSPDRDQYIVWSNIADGPTYVGTRADLLGLAGCNEVDAVEQRIARADRTGSSSHLGVGSYADPGMIYDDRGWILRSDLAAFADAIAADDQVAADALITPDRESTDA